MRDGQTTLACREEERPEAIMDEFCGADFGKCIKPHSRNLARGPGSLISHHHTIAPQYRIKSDSAPTLQLPSCDSVAPGAAPSKAAR